MKCPHCNREVIGRKRTYCDEGCRILCKKDRLKKKKQGKLKKEGIRCDFCKRNYAVLFKYAQAACKQCINKIREDEGNVI